MGLTFKKKEVIKMLSALNINNKKIVARNASKNNEYFCPVCGESLILKQGEKNIAHFAHQANSTCWYRSNESHNHMAMKEIIRDCVTKNNNVINGEFEYILKFSNGHYLIADYYAEIMYNGRIYKVAFEIVEAHDNYDDFEAKNVTYFDNDIYVVWVFNHEDINPYQNAEWYGLEIRTKEIHRVAHTLGFGKVYSIDIPNRTLYCTHFDRVARVNNPCIDCSREGSYYCENNCNYGGEHITYPKTIRVPDSRKITNFVINSFNKQYANKYIHFNVCKANMFIEKWW